MPGLFVAAELILTCYLTESPWIIIFSSDRQVGSASELVLIQGCVSIKRKMKTMASIHSAGGKVIKIFSRFILQYESSRVILCVL